MADKPVLAKVKSVFDYEAEEPNELTIHDGKSLFLILFSTAIIFTTQSDF